MATRIYVGSLPYRTTDEDLQNMFAAYGTVNEATVITDRFTGQSKGFGFVEMAEDGEAQSAINALNGSTVEGRSLVVNVARDRETRSGGGGGGGRGYGGGGGGGGYGGGGGGGYGGGGGGGGRDRRGGGNRY